LTPQPFRANPRDELGTCPRTPEHTCFVLLPGSADPLENGSLRNLDTKVGQVLVELSVWQSKLGEPPPKTPETDPRQIIASTITYLTNNRDRMKYAAYRQAGLPITTAWMESLVKEMNYRIKGTEMFWNDPEGGEAIAQVRAASLSEDDRLSKHLHTRSGCVFTRRPKSPKLLAKTCKS
jgi:hypothetical protein